MKYNLIEIRPNSYWEQERWSVSFDNSDELDREADKKYQPHSLGFFYYPKKWKPEKAFQILKDDMIKTRQNEINRLQLDMEAIKNLKLPDWVK